MGTINWLLEIRSGFRPIFIIKTDHAGNIRHGLKHVAFLAAEGKLGLARLPAKTRDLLPDLSLTAAIVGGLIKGLVVDGNLGSIKGQSLTELLTAQILLLGWYLGLEYQWLVFWLWLRQLCQCWSLLSWEVATHLGGWLLKIHLWNSGIHDHGLISGKILNE